MPFDWGARTPATRGRTPALSVPRLLAAAAAIAACGPGSRPAADQAARALSSALQNRIDRFARVERDGLHRLRITVQEKARAAPTQADVARLAQLVARGAYDVRAAAPGDTVTVVVQRPRRFGPLAWDGPVMRYTFTAAPVIPQSGILF